MHKIRLIALDLDGTLLNSEKELTPENAAAIVQETADSVTDDCDHDGVAKAIRSLLG